MLCKAKGGLGGNILPGVNLGHKEEPWLGPGRRLVAKDHQVEVISCGTTGGHLVPAITDIQERDKVRVCGLKVLHG